MPKMTLYPMEGFMKEQLIEVLANSVPLTIPEICNAISLNGTEVRSLLSELLSEKTIKVIVEPNEFGCTGCPCGSCDPIAPKYALL